MEEAKTCYNCSVLKPLNKFRLLTPGVSIKPGSQCGWCADCEKDYDNERKRNAK